MRQTSRETEISITAQIIFADYNMSNLKYPGGNVLIALALQHSIFVTILH